MEDLKNIYNATNITNSGDWKSYRMLIINEINRFDKQINELNIRLNNIDKEIAALNVKSGIWGLLGGLLPSMLTIIYFIISKKI